MGRAATDRISPSNRARPECAQPTLEQTRKIYVNRVLCVYIKLCYKFSLQLDIGTVQLDWGGVSFNTLTGRLSSPIMKPVSVYVCGFWGKNN